MRHWWEVEVVNVGQESCPTADSTRAHADISINSYESRIERTGLCVMQICEVHPRAFHSREIWMQMRGTLENRERLPVSRKSRSVESRVDAARARKEGHDAPRRADKPDEKELPGKSHVPKSLRNPLRMPLGLTISAWTVQDGACESAKQKDAITSERIRANAFFAFAIR